jgi:DUF4097 and DUF4098 domain-containing protein YvlB
MGSRFSLDSATKIRVLTASGKVEVVGEERSDVEIEPDLRKIEFKDGGRTLEIKSGSKSVSVRCPSGIDISVGAMSGSVHLRGQFGSVKVSGISGSVNVDSAHGDVDARSVSGSVSVNRCDGNCHLHSKSGSIRIGLVQKAASAFTISGSVEIGTAGRDEVEAHTVSGSVKVKIAPGRFPRVRLRSLSGKLRCDCPQGSDFEINVKTLSGSADISEL